MKNIEIKKLEALLNHWITHTEEHSIEFKEWSQKANDAKLANISNYMQNASKGMDTVKKTLILALDELKKIVK